MATSSERYQRRVLAVLVLLCVPSWAVTAAVVRLFHGQQASLAREWTARGDSSSASHDYAQAVESYRTALLLSSDRPDIRLRLAQALAAHGQSVEARAYLIALRDRTPGDGVVNLELARLAAAAGDRGMAVRYYHDAIEGAWPVAPIERRWFIRLEVAGYLANNGDDAAAQAELVPLTTSLPDDARVRLRVAQLLAQTGAWARALDTYRATLAIDRQNAEAMAGAGEAAFQLARYRSARAFLSDALAHRPKDTASRERLVLVDSIFALDPFARGLSRTERDARVRTALDLASARLAACPAVAATLTAAPSNELHARRSNETTTSSALLDEVRRQWQQTRVHDRDMIDSTMDAVFAIEDRASTACGSLTGRDLALFLIGRQRRDLER